MPFHMLPEMNIISMAIAAVSCTCTLMLVVSLRNTLIFGQPMSINATVTTFHRLLGLVASFDLIYAISWMLTNAPVCRLQSVMMQFGIFGSGCCSAFLAIELVIVMIGERIFGRQKAARMASQNAQKVRFRVYTTVVL